MPIKITMPTNVTVSVSTADVEAIRDGADPGAIAAAVAQITKAVVDALKPPSGVKRRAPSPEIPAKAPRMALRKAIKVEESADFRVTVRDVAGRKHGFTVQPSTTIEEVKLLLVPAMDRPKDDMRLIYAGRQLEDGRNMQHVCCF